jgi:hypothetical protein
MRLQFEEKLDQKKKKKIGLLGVRTAATKRTAGEALQGLC